MCENPISKLSPAEPALSLEMEFSHTLKPVRFRGKSTSGAKEVAEKVSVDEKIAPSAARATFTTKQLWTA